MNTTLYKKTYQMYHNIWKKILYSGKSKKSQDLDNMMKFEVNFEYQSKVCLGYFEGGVRQLTKNLFLATVSTKGFSLIEVLIALTLFGFLISGIITFVTAGLDVTQKTGEKLAIHHDENTQMRQLESAIVFPVKRIDSGISSVSTTSGAILQIDGKTMFIGTQSMTGICNSGSIEPYLVTFTSPSLSKNENLVYGNYHIANDGLSVYSGSIRIIGSGVRGGNTGSPLETEFGGISSMAGTGNTIALADPNNEQILFWNSSLSPNLFPLSTRNTGIQEPTSVQFSGNHLLIGGKNGLFRMQDTIEDGSKLESNSIEGPPNTLSSLGKIQITLDGGTAITSPTGTGDIILEQFQGGVWQSLNDPNDSLTVTGSGYIYTFSGTTRNINAGNLLHLKITNIAVVPSTSGQYSASMNFYDTADTRIWEKKMPYFVHGDGYIESLNGNRIERISAFPQVRNVTNETTFDSGSLQLDDFLSTYGEMTISPLPIRNFGMTETSNSIMMNFEAYTDYNCTSGVQNSKQRTLIFRKK